MIRTGTRIERKKSVESKLCMGVRGQLYYTTDRQVKESLDVAGRDG